MSANVILGSLPEKYAAVKRGFSLESRAKVDEISSLLQESIYTFDGLITSRIQVIWHGLKGQAGTFGYPMILEIALVAEQYVKTTPEHDDAKARNLVALCEIMTALLPDDEDIDRPNESIGTAHPKPTVFYYRT